MGLSVIRRFSAVRFYFNLVLLGTILDLQRSFGLADVIVVCLGVAVQCIAECVRTLAHHCLAACECVRRTFAFNPARLCRQGRVSVHQRCSVVFLLQVRALQRYGALTNCQLAGCKCRCAIVPGRINFAMRNGISNSFTKCAIIIGPSIGSLGRSIGDSQYIAFCQTCYSIFICTDCFSGTSYGGDSVTQLFRSVIGNGTIIDLHTQFSCINFQSAEFFFYGIVLFLRSSPCYFIIVGDFTNCRNCSDSSYCCSFSVYKTGNRRC